jgi:hypothetical protein
MESALHVLSPKPYTGKSLKLLAIGIHNSSAHCTQDILVQQFLVDTNYHYYCLYPPVFSDDYSRWWADRASGQTLAPEFTCLLLRMCLLLPIFGCKNATET